MVRVAAMSKMEELLIDMKADVARLPGELAKMPSVSIQLKIDEISTISKLAKTPVSQSVITQAPPSNLAPLKTSSSRSKSPKLPKKDVVMVDKPKSSSQPTALKYKVAYANPPAPSTQPGPQVQLPPGSGLAMQTAEGLVVYSVASAANPPQAVSVVQAGSTSATTTTTSGGQTITIGVPTYLDGSNLYQTVQLVPAVSGQQVVYWPPVVGSGQAPAQVTTVAAAATGGGATVGNSQLAVVQRSSTPHQSVQFSAEVATSSGATPTSVITID